MPLLNKALSVGALVAVSGVAFLVAFTFFKKGGYSEKESYVVHAFFEDATGLTWKSRVQIAGIQVGEVDKITLEGQRARLQLRIKNGVELKTSACLTKSFPSPLLPDALLEVSLGAEAAPSLSSLPLEQREVKCVRESASTQKLIESMSKIAADVQVVTTELTKLVGDQRGSMREIIENIANLTRRLDATVEENSGKLSRLLSNAEAISGDLRDLTGSEKAHIRDIVGNIEVVSRQLRQLLASTQSIIEGTPVPGAAPGAILGPGPAPGAADGVAAAPSVRAGQAGQAGQAGPGVQAGPPGPAGPPGRPGPAGADARGVRQAVEKANDSLARLDKLMAKLTEGDGVVGKLLNDERLGNKVADAVETYTNYVDSMSRMQIEVRLRSEWLLNQTAAKTYFGIRLLPRPDKYYILEVVSDPRGVDNVVTTTTTTRDPAVPGSDVTNITTTTTHEQKLTYSLQMAKRYGPVAFRVGIIESSGGVGSDLHLFDDRLQVSVSVYQFSRPFPGVFPRAKVWINWAFMQHFFITAGTDDFLNQWRAGRYPFGPRFSPKADVFLGGGIHFTDEDLKMLVGMGAASAVTPALK
jgi:phospholipid/cholesterol/gamma-HCH transport system substrate-binding protein